MALQFESLDYDIAGRCGKLAVGKKIIKTPALLPVINPHLPLITPAEMQKMGVEAIITNAYIFSQSMQFREQALAEGLHTVLDFDGVIMTDSGSFQLSVYGEVSVSNLETLSFQRDIRSDIWVPLDIPTSPSADHATAERELAITMERLREAKATFGDDAPIAAPVQGGIHPDLRKRAGTGGWRHGLYVLPDRCCRAAHGGVPVPRAGRGRHGGKNGCSRHLPASTSLAPGTRQCLRLLWQWAATCLTRLRTRSMQKREGISPLMAVTRLTNSSSSPVPARSAGAIPLTNCSTSGERERLLALHNLYVTLAEIARIRQAVTDGTLWELVDERCRGHPQLLSGYRELLAHTDTLERSDRATKRRFFYRGNESCLRTEVVRYQKNLSRLRLGRDVLIAFDGNMREGSSDLLLFKPPFGPYPKELKETFPIGQSEIPDWDEAMVRQGCRGISALITSHPESRFVVACNARWVRIVREELPGVR